MFVAMPFGGHFDTRWTTVIRPAVESLQIEGGERLTAHRVDLRSAGDSVVTEITTNICTFVLILADVSTIGSIDARTVRNGNVLYEVGLAHGLRLPEEVLLFRSDNDPLDFDLANVRVHRYEPESNPTAAIELIRSKILDSQKELNLTRSAVVRSIVERLDIACWNVLTDHPSDGKAKLRGGMELGAGIGAIHYDDAVTRLLSMGVLEMSYDSGFTDEIPWPSVQIHDLLKFKRTKLGDMVAKVGFERFGLTSARLERWRQGNEAAAARSDATTAEPE